MRRRHTRRPFFFFSLSLPMISPPRRLQFIRAYYTVHKSIHTVRAYTRMQYYIISLLSFCLRLRRSARPPARPPVRPSPFRGVRSCAPRTRIGLATARLACPGRRICFMRVPCYHRPVSRRKTTRYDRAAQHFSHVQGRRKRVSQKLRRRVTRDY